MYELVTLIGGGGFVGRYVAQALMRQGWRVRVAQRDPRQAFYLKPLGGLGQTQFVAADVTRPDTIARAVEGADAVVNLVGSFGDAMRIQAEGASTVAKAVAASGAKALVHLSAIGADSGSASTYARSKGLGEEAVRAAFPAATILRPSVVFGREDQFLNRFAEMIRRTRIVPVVRPDTRFQPVFAGDVGDAVAAVLKEPARFAGQLYELGGPDVLSMADLLKWIATETGRSPHFVTLPDAAAGLIARLPGAPITRDQLLLLQKDNVVAGSQDGLEALGLTATPMSAVASNWLVRFRRQGRFARRRDELAA
ncbi:complex I NDUFA9 subunit family protein [Sphingomonas gellani]|nr:complex I NDUFA9 subunit family protein [Sphingomonas gellani]